MKNSFLISLRQASAGFDFTSGKKIEQKLLDYNQEAERFGCYAYEELSEISPDHQYLEYSMYDKDNDYFKLYVRDLYFGSLCNKPQAHWISSIAWAKNGHALFYVVTDDKKYTEASWPTPIALPLRWGPWEAENHWHHLRDVFYWSRDAWGRRTGRYGSAKLQRQKDFAHKTK